jgi:hypothetical protein
MRKTVALLALLTWLSAGCKAGGKQEVLPGVNALVFAKRAFIEASGQQNVSDGAGRVVDYQRYTPGGGVFVLTPPTPDGTLSELTKSFSDVDIAGLDLSFDAKQVVFAMRHKGDDGHYHIYTTKVDGSEKPKQLTFAMADDVRPLFVPGDRIAFVTNESYTPLGTRADEYNHGRESTQMATVSSITGDADRKVCGQSLSHTADPFLMSDGTIGYSRWEHLGPVNDLKLFHMNPDCTDMLALAGQHNKDFNSIVQVREESPGVLVGIATSREGTIQAGAVMRIDARARSGSSVLDEQTASFTSLTPRVPTGMDALVPSGVGRYRTPYTLDDGRLLVTWADGDVSDRAAVRRVSLRPEDRRARTRLRRPEVLGHVRVARAPAQRTTRARRSPRCTDQCRAGCLRWQARDDRLDRHHVDVAERDGQWRSVRDRRAAGDCPEASRQSAHHRRLLVGSRFGARVRPDHA